MLPVLSSSTILDGIANGDHHCAWPQREDGEPVSIYPEHHWDIEAACDELGFPREDKGPKTADDILRFIENGCRMKPPVKVLSYLQVELKRHPLIGPDEFLKMRPETRTTVCLAMGGNMPRGWEVAMAEKEPPEVFRRWYPCRLSSLTATLEALAWLCESEKDAMDRVENRFGLRWISVVVEKVRDWIAEGWLDCEEPEEREGVLVDPMTGVAMLWAVGDGETLAAVCEYYRRDLANWARRLVDEVGERVRLGLRARRTGAVVPPPDAKADGGAIDNTHKEQ